MTQIANVLNYAEQYATAKVGDGATLVHYTDRTACTVIKVSESGKTITVQEDKAERTDKNGMSEIQEYSITADPNGVTHVVRLGKKGWRAYRGTLKVLVGVRSQYHDYSF
jgi:hypothetical protein